MKKIIIGALFPFLVLMHLTAQEKFIEKWGVKEILEEDSIASIQILNMDKPRVVALTTYPVPDDVVPTHWIKKSNYSTLDFYVEYTAVFNSQVRFYFIWTGPEFFSYTTDWDNARYNRFAFFGLTSSISDWAKGTYKLVVIAEQKTIGSGAECVAECIFRIF